MTAGGSSKGVVSTAMGSFPAIASAGPDQKVAGGSVVVLSGVNSIEAARGLPASYQWRQVDGPPLILADPRSVETWFTAPEAGLGGASLCFELTITGEDGFGSKGTCIVNATEANAPPVAHARNGLEVTPSEIVVLDGSGSHDPDGEALTYAWKQIEGPHVELFDAKSVMPSFIAPYAGAGGVSLVFEVTVTDVGGLRSRDRCVVNVTVENDPPRADAGMKRKVLPGIEASLDGSNSEDTEDVIASCQWTQTAGKPVKLSNPMVPRPTFVAPETGAEPEVLVFEVTVTDAGGLKQKDKVAITVRREK